MNSIFHNRVTVANRRAFREETTFGSCRHDHGIFYDLRLHEAEDFSTKILATV